jgi:hypothetical protein
VKMRAILRYCRMVRRRLDPVLEQTGSLRYLA